MTTPSTLCAGVTKEPSETHWPMGKGVCAAVLCRTPHCMAMCVCSLILSTLTLPQPPQQWLQPAPSQLYLLPALLLPWLLMFHALLH